MSRIRKVAGTSQKNERSIRTLSVAEPTSVSTTFQRRHEMKQAALSTIVAFLTCSALTAGEVTVNYISGKNGSTHYSIPLGNSDKIRKATHVDLVIGFYDWLNRLIGEDKVASFDIEIPPDDSKNVTID